jgi:hypothetical protein
VDYWHRMPLTGKRWDIRLVSYSEKTPTFCIFPVFSVAVMESVVTLAVTGSSIFPVGISDVAV